MNIIVASSDGVSRKLLADLLESPLNCVRMTTKSSELIQWVLDEDVDAVVVDVDLGGMDGLESLPILKHLRPKLPIIMLSADASTEVSRRIAEVGVFYHFVKPIDPSDMIHVMRAVGTGGRRDRR